MPTKYKFHRPNGNVSRRRSETVINAPYTWAGNEYNSDARYDAIAQHTGCIVLASHAAGTGKVYIDSATRRSLRPGRLHELAAEEAAFFERATQGRFSTRIGLGDSGRATWVAAMQLSQPNGHRPFTHVLTRDGVNLEAPQATWRAVQRVIKGSNSRGETRHPATAPKQEIGKLAMAYTGLCAASEIIVNRRLLASDASRKVHLDLAQQIETPYMNVMLGHGLSGSAAKAQQFNYQLARERLQASDGGVLPATLLPVYEAAWGHNNLMDPDLLAGHIKQLIDL